MLLVASSEMPVILVILFRRKRVYIYDATRRMSNTKVYSVRLSWWMLLEIVQFVGVIYRLGFKLSYNFIKNKNQHFNIILKVGKQISTTKWSIIIS